MAGGDRSPAGGAPATADDVRGWFRQLERCVRATDYDAARPIFAAEAVGFGTYGAILEGLDALVAGQWSKVWPNIGGFTFNLDTLRWGADGELAWAICLWDSEGRRPDGTTFPRPGRATVVLRRGGTGWQALHTHFSLIPTDRGKTGT